jgi:hypothetical protein
VAPHHLGRWHGAVVPVAAVLVLASTFSSEPVLVTGLVAAAMIAVSLATLSRHGQPARPT